MTRILVLGATGMLGNAVMQVLFSYGMDVFGTVRSERSFALFSKQLRARLISDVDLTNEDDVVKVLADLNPQVVVNCAGIVKQLSAANDPLVVLPLNTMFPHRLSALCKLAKARLIHISTDCVFSGSVGNYSEDNIPDATDLYGISKRLGEVGGDHCVTLRTSIIGHELQGSHSLLDWFLHQKDRVFGYTEAFFSGLPTNELARIIAEFVIPNKNLNGLFHVSANRISKYDLLNIAKDVYGHDLEIIPKDTLKIDRSLNSIRFQQATGYVAPDWRALIESLKKFKFESNLVNYSN